MNHRPKPSESERRQLMRRKCIHLMEVAGVDWACGTCGRLMEDKEEYVLFKFGSDGTMCSTCVDYCKDLLAGKIDS